jgi:hypothetical protein
MAHSFVDALQGFPMCKGPDLAYISNSVHRRAAVAVLDEGKPLSRTRERGSG